MHEYITFFLKHWLLTLAFIVVVILIFIEEYRSRTGGGAKLAPNEAVQKINREDATILDIRSGDAFRKGHIINAINVPEKDLAANAAKLEKYKTKPLILVCQNGLNSAKLLPKLKKQGFEQVFLLGGGVDAWKRDSLPIKT